MYVLQVAFPFGMDANGSPVPNSAQFHRHDAQRQADPLPRYNGIERLKKRIGNYRQHHTVCGPRFNQSFSDACEQQSMETVVLHKRSLQHKAKKAPKKASKAAAQEPPINVPPAIKQEPDFGHRLSPDFADLDECAAALERDAATIGLNDSDTLNIIISELSDLDNVDFPDFKQEPGIEPNWHKPQMSSRLGGGQLGSSKGQGIPAMSASVVPMNETLVPIQSIKQEPRSTLSMPFVVPPPMPQSLAAQQVDLNRNVGGPRPFGHQVNTVHFASKNVMASGAPVSQFPIVPKQGLLLAPPHQQPLHMPHNAFNKHPFAAMPMQNATHFMGPRPNAMRFPPHQPANRQQPMMRAPLMRPQMANWTAMPNSTGMAMQPQHQVFMQQPCRPPFMHATAASASTTNTDWRNSAMMPPQQSIHFNDNGNSLEFLENLAVGDASNFPAQDLLSSLDSVVTADDFDDILGTV